MDKYKNRGGMEVRGIMSMQLLTSVRATFTLTLSSTGCNRLALLQRVPVHCSLISYAGGNTPVRIPGYETMMDGAS